MTRSPRRWGRRRAQRAFALLPVLLAIMAAACTSTPSILRREPLRLSELAAVGDAQRQASMRIVLEGLAEDAAFAPQRGLPRYELALQVDPTNPYAYLALARHHAELGAGGRALGYLERAEALLAAQGDVRERLRPHLVGLRGWALAADGPSARSRAALREAARTAPAIWGDGRLSAAELR